MTRRTVTSRRIGKLVFIDHGTYVDEYAVIGAYSRVGHHSGIGRKAVLSAEASVGDYVGVRQHGIAPDGKRLI